MTTTNLQKHLSSNNYKYVDGVYFFNALSGHDTKLNRTNVLEDLGRGRIWKNVYAHYFRFLFVTRWLKPNKLLIDVGCGRGWLMDLIYRNRFQVSYIGIDLSEASLRHASKKNFKYPRMLIKSNCLSLNLHSAIADYVVCLETIEHNNKEDGQSIIEECLRILKPGGLLFISTPIRKGSRKVFPKDHIYEWEYYELSNYLEENCLEIIRVFGCFGKKTEIVDSLDPIEKQLYTKYSEYFSWHVLSPFFSVLHPEVSQGAIWLCKKPLLGEV